MHDLSAPSAAQALLLAAGRGERMRPLTDHCPKPLLPVRGQALMRWQLDAMARAGLRHVLINTAWLEAQIIGEIGPTCPSNGRNVLSISYSTEGRDFGRALETLGGIVRALPRLAPVFWLAAGDVFAPDFDFGPGQYRQLERPCVGGEPMLGHLWLVPNPPQHPEGDFALVDGWVRNEGPQRWTYSTLALLRRELFQPPWCDIPEGNPEGLAAPLAPLLRRAADAGRLGGSVYSGLWADVGTPGRLAALNGA